MGKSLTNSLKSIYSKKGRLGYSKGLGFRAFSACFSLILRWSSRSYPRPYSWLFLTLYPRNKLWILTTSLRLASILGGSMRSRNLKTANYLWIIRAAGFFRSLTSRPDLIIYSKPSATDKRSRNSFISACCYFTFAWDSSSWLFKACRSVTIGFFNAEFKKFCKI